MRILPWFKDKYDRLEIAFFIFYYFFFGILTDIEFQIFESGNLLHSNQVFVTRHIVRGIIAIIPVWILYKLIIQPYLFQKRYLKFVLMLCLYLVALNFYNLYVNWGVSKMSFLPDEVTNAASQFYHGKTWIHLGGAMYTLREFMVLAFLAYFIKSAKQEQQMNELKQKQLYAELKYLKVQLQPHFFFNTLNNIYALTLQRSDKAAHWLPVILQ